MAFPCGLRFLVLVTPFTLAIHNCVNCSGGRATVNASSAEKSKHVDEEELIHQIGDGEDGSPPKKDDAESRVDDHSHTGGDDAEKSPQIASQSSSVLAGWWRKVLTAPKEEAESGNQKEAKNGADNHDSLGKIGKLDPSEKAYELTQESESWWDDSYIDRFSVAISWLKECFVYVFFLWYLPPQLRLVVIRLVEHSSLAQSVIQGVKDSNKRAIPGEEILGLHPSTSTSDKAQRDEQKQNELALWLITLITQLKKVLGESPMISSAVYRIYGILTSPFLPDVLRAFGLLSILTIYIMRCSPIPMYTRQCIGCIPCVFFNVLPMWRYWKLKGLNLHDATGAAGRDHEAAEVEDGKTAKNRRGELQVTKEIYLRIRPLISLGQSFQQIIRKLQKCSGDNGIGHEGSVTSYDPRADPAGNIFMSYLLPGLADPAGNRFVEKQVTKASGTAALQTVVRVNGQEIGPLSDVTYVIPQAILLDKNPKLTDLNSPARLLLFLLCIYPTACFYKVLYLCAESVNCICPLGECVKVVCSVPFLIYNKLIADREEFEII